MKKTISSEVGIHFNVIFVVSYEIILYISYALCYMHCDCMFYIFGSSLQSNTAQDTSNLREL